MTDADAAHLGVSQPIGDQPAGPLVSVIIPTYNSRDLLAEALDALDMQTLPAEAIEIIVVDDGSTDGTWEMLSELRVARPNLRTFRQANSGRPSVARNRGLERATGRYVFFNDADDYLAPDALRRLVAFAEEMGADVVVCRKRRVGRGDIERPFGGIVADADLIKDRIWMSLGPMKLFRRALIDRLRVTFPEDMVQGEDQVFVASCLFAAERVSVLKDYDYYYRRTREDNRNISRRPQTLDNKLSTTTRMTRLIVANTAPGARRDRFLRRVLIGTLGPALRQPFEGADANERRRFLAVIQADVLPHLTEGMLKYARGGDRLRLRVARIGTAEDLLKVNALLRKGLRYSVEEGVLCYDLDPRLNQIVGPQARAVGTRLGLGNRLVAAEPVRMGLRLRVDADSRALPIDTIELVAKRRGERPVVLDTVPAGDGHLTFQIRPIALWAAGRRQHTASPGGQRWMLGLRARHGALIVARSRLSVCDPDTSPAGTAAGRRPSQRGGLLIRATLRSGRRGVTLTVTGPADHIAGVLRRPCSAAKRVFRRLLRSSARARKLLSPARTSLTGASLSLRRTYLRRGVQRDLSRLGLPSSTTGVAADAPSSSAHWAVDLAGVAIRFRLELTPRESVLEVAGRDTISKRVLRSVLIGAAPMTRKPQEHHVLGRWPSQGPVTRVRRAAVERTRWLAAQLETLPHEGSPERPVPPGHVLTYWWDYKPNFGDTIGPWLVHELTGMPVVNSKWLHLQQPALFTVGSVVGHLQAPGHHIWGSGVIGSLSPAKCEQLRRSRPAAIHAIRGRLSRQELIEKLGWDVPEIYGDPALLLPRYYRPRPAKTTAGKVAVVPHYSHQRLFAGLRAKRTRVVDATEGLERVLDEIAGASHCISTSLHGVIVAHAFGVPWTWLRIGDQQLHGNRFKFEDFFTVLDRDQVSEATVSTDGVKALDVVGLASRARLPRTTFDLDRLHDAFPLAIVAGA